ncbi:MAG: type III pantothenate kinase [Candidatus Eisenbacteria sp.]|nr:type III pantothenate kinase [Candidatus Eisenbacteria bacterium]
MDCSVAQSPSAGRSPGDILLAIDIGNTQTVLGIFAGEELVTFRRVSSGVARTGDELAVLIAALCRGHNQRVTRAGRIVISSVVPALTQEYEVMCERLYARRPLVVTSRTRAGVRLEVPDPASIGADRIANAAAVAGGPLPAIVVDLGTATTFDVVRPGRRYVGGAIAPGIRTSADELFRRAARLARVEIRQPLRRIGRTTEESVQSGVYYGAIGTIDGIVRRLEEDLRRPARIVATGGLAPLIGAGSETIQEVDEALTLRGLLRIVRLNS